MQNKLCENAYKENFKEVSKRIFDMTADLIKETEPGSEEMEHCLCIMKMHCMFYNKRS